MATFLRPLGILLRNHLSTYNIKSRSCEEKLLRIQQFICPDHPKKELHSLYSIKSRKDLKVEDLARPACGYILFSRSMTQTGVDANNMIASTELAEFDALFPELVDDLTKDEIKNPEIADAFIWFKEVLYYNVPMGRRFIGVSVVTSYKHLVSGASEADLKIARVLGWCVELFQAFFLIVDDIADSSLTRRGQPCWYRQLSNRAPGYTILFNDKAQADRRKDFASTKNTDSADPKRNLIPRFVQDNVGLTAINDSFFVECCIYSLLRKYVRDKPYYLSIMELFLQSTLQSEVGLCLDLTTSKAKGDFSQFTMERVNAIAKWKTSFFAFYFPVAIAMHMAGIADEELHSQAKTMLFQMGQFYQTQNDYLDCYGAPEVTEKIGNDIEENKCSWLIVKALEIASDEQKEELKLNYGRCDKEAVEKVKAIYGDLKLKDVYKQYEESSYQEIINCINSLDSAVPKEVFQDFTSILFKCDK